MGRKRKDGKIINCILETSLVRGIENYSEMTGLTKTAVMEKALSTFLGPYKCDTEKPVEAVYLSGGSDYERMIAEKEGREPDIREEPCYVLGEANMYDKPYYRIVKDGALMKVPVSMIRFN